VAGASPRVAPNVTEDAQLFCASVKAGGFASNRDETASGAVEREFGGMDDGEVQQGDASFRGMVCTGVRGMLLPAGTR